MRWRQRGKLEPYNNTSMLIKSHFVFVSLQLSLGSLLVLQQMNLLFTILFRKL